MRSIPRVKICGISRLEDALTAVGCGADAVGFLVGLDYPNRDALSPEQAAALIRGLPPFVTSVLVTHRTEIAEVRDLCRRAAPQNVQLHGDFPLGRISELRRALPHLKIVKTIHIDGEAAVEEALNVAREADGILLDTRSGHLLGGTGRTHDWSISRRIVERVEVPVILAGGLTPGNVASAIETVRPWGVDVNTGVRKAAGGKSHGKLESFIRHAKSCPSASARLA